METNCEKEKKDVVQNMDENINGEKQIDEEKNQEEEEDDEEKRGKQTNIEWSKRLKFALLCCYKVRL